MPGPLLGPTGKPLILNGKPSLCCCDGGGLPGIHECAACADLLPASVTLTLPNWTTSASPYCDDCDELNGMELILDFDTCGYYLDELYLFTCAGHSIYTGIDVYLAASAVPIGSGLWSVGFGVGFDPDTSPGGSVDISGIGGSAPCRGTHTITTSLPSYGGVVPCGEPGASTTYTLTLVV